MLIQNSSSHVPRPSMPARENAAAADTVPTAALLVAPQSLDIQQAAPQTESKTAEKPVSALQLQSAVQNTNKAMQASSKDLVFSVDTDTKQTVVKLLDSKTGDVIGQFPTQQMLDISKAISVMQEQLQLASLTKSTVQSTQGLLIQQQA